MLRIIRELRPRYIVGENVAGIVSWNGGLVFEEVQTDLEAEGYEVQAVILPACAVNAPHRRDRVWFVAHRSVHGLHGSENRQGVEKGNGGNKKRQNQAGQFARCSGKNAKPTPNPRDPKPQGRDESQEGQQHTGRRKPRGKFSPFGSSCAVADTTGTGRKERKQSRFGKDCPQDGAGLHDRPKRFGSNGRFVNATDTTSRRRFQGMRQPGPEKPAHNLSDWRGFPTQSPVCSRNDGLSGRLAGITVSRHRRESIKAYGNAIVPQVAVQIFRAIIEAERRMNHAH